MKTYFDAFLKYADAQGMALLHDDKMWLKKIIDSKSDYEARQLLYVYAAKLVRAMEKETVSYQKQNVGRKEANDWIRTHV